MDAPQPLQTALSLSEPAQIGYQYPFVAAYYDICDFSLSGDKNRNLSLYFAGYCTDLTGKFPGDYLMG